MIAPGQVWLDLDRGYQPRRYIRIETIERRGLLRFARVSARQGDEPWRIVTRPIRLDRFSKNFKLQG